MDISKGKFVFNFYLIFQSNYSQSRVNTINQQANSYSIPTNTLINNFEFSPNSNTIQNNVMSSGNSNTYNPNKSLHYITKKKEAVRIDYENKKLMKSIMKQYL